MDRHVVYQSIFDRRADKIPVGTVVFQTAQDQRIAQDDLHRVMIEHFLADGNDIGSDVRIGIPARSQRIGDDARTFARRDEKKVMAKILNRRVNIGRVSERSEATCDIRVTTRGLGSQNQPEQRQDAGSRANSEP
jgi:hypothetical protein